MITPVGLQQGRVNTQTVQSRSNESQVLVRFGASASDTVVFNDENVERLTRWMDSKTDQLLKTTKSSTYNGVSLLTILNQVATVQKEVVDHYHEERTGVWSVFRRKQEPSIDPTADRIVAGLKQHPELKPIPAERLKDAIQELKSLDLLKIAFNSNIINFVYSVGKLGEVVLAKANNQPVPALSHQDLKEIAPIYVSEQLKSDKPVG